MKFRRYSVQGFEGMRQLAATYQRTHELGEPASTPTEYMRVDYSGPEPVGYANDEAGFEVKL